MHKQLKALLKNAEGESHHVIVVVADIRGFSKFSHKTDSADVATYISKIYIKLIEAFSQLSDNLFYKTTGDGMLMTIPYKESDLEKLFRSVVKTCFECHDSFDSLLKKEKIINFPIPNKIGFGISRGSACALISSNIENELLTLDYSGHKLNIASRFQDLARPSGVIFEGPHDITLLDDETKKLFNEEQVYVKSVAESAPISIFVSNTVKIPNYNLKPLSATWETYNKSYKLTEFKKQSDSNLHFELVLGEIITKSLLVKLYRTHIPGKETPRSIYWKDLKLNEHYELYYEKEQPILNIKYPKIFMDHKDFIDLIPPRGKARLEIIYQVIPKHN